MHSCLTSSFLTLSRLHVLFYQLLLWDCSSLLCEEVALFYFFYVISRRYPDNFALVILCWLISLWLLRSPEICTPKYLQYITGALSYFFLFPAYTPQQFFRYLHGFIFFCWCYYVILLRYSDKFMEDAARHRIAFDLSSYTHLIVLRC